MKRALISVSDKSGLVEFAKELVALNYEIISTGGTMSTLVSNGIKCINISQFTGFPEILEGRVKTLHPKVHGGLLAVRDSEEHCKQVKDNDIQYIDLVVVNLYPFKQTIDKSDCTLEQAIENIDIGGPSMLRSAAKNHRFVTVVCDSSDYSKVLAEIKINGDTTIDTRNYLSAKVFRHTASYDSLIAEYLTNKYDANATDKLTLTFEGKSDLRYGENPHQKAHFYKTPFNYGYSLANAVQLQGKELSYNNIQDANATLEIIREFSSPTAVAVKHMNPCGVASAENINLAFEKAYNCDSVSIFGGIVALNRQVDEELATVLSKIFLEIIMAPSFTSKALEVLSAKKDVRVLQLDFDEAKSPDKKFVSVCGGVLVQDVDRTMVGKSDLQVVTKIAPTDKQLEELLFALKVVKHIKSNAIVVSNDTMTLGVGAGQMNRVGSALIALEQAKGKSNELILASDAFFPFDDTVKLAKLYNVVAIVQPGGSKRDADSIAMCDELGIAMVFSGIRHFKH